MTDDDFLSYCVSMTDTPRCGFVPQNIARLMRLAGDNVNAAEWDAAPNHIVSGCHDQIRRLVERARSRLVAA